MIRVNSTRSIATEPRELDSRTSDGIHVQLLWQPLDGHVSVAVNDTKTGEAFELDVRHGQDALDVYHHPYAYAATNVSTNAIHRSSPASSRPRSRPITLGS
jgi:hypothetical protein